MTLPNLSPTEWQLMNAIWASRGATTVRDVHDALAPDTGWAYTTVKTMMDRLVDKGVLSVTREGRTAHYRASLTRSRARRSAARNLLDRAFDGAAAPLVQELLRSRALSPGERDELRRMLDDLEDNA
jgi:BlaI family penicillinase repressor